MGKENLKVSESNLVRLQRSEGKIMSVQGRIVDVVVKVKGRVRLNGSLILQKLDGRLVKIDGHIEFENPEFDPVAEFQNRLTKIGIVLLCGMGSD